MRDLILSTELPERNMKTLIGSWGDAFTENYKRKGMQKHISSTPVRLSLRRQQDIWGTETSRAISQACLDVVSCSFSLRPGFPQSQPSHPSVCAAAGSLQLPKRPTYLTPC